MQVSKHKCVKACVNACGTTSSHYPLTLTPPTHTTPLHTQTPENRRCDTCPCHNVSPIQTGGHSHFRPHYKGTRNTQPSSVGLWSQPGGRLSRLTSSCDMRSLNIRHCPCVCVCVLCVLCVCVCFENCIRVLNSKYSLFLRFLGSGFAF